MSDQEIIRLAIEEIEQKRFGFTGQFLEIHELVYENDKPRMAHIDRESPDGRAIVYFPVKDEKFYLTIYIKTSPTPEVNWVDEESGHSVYFRALSKELDFAQLAAMTTLTPTNGWSKGDRRKNGTTTYRFSSIHIMPNPEPDAFEDKLRKLLDFLEHDSEGIRKLSALADGHIQVATIFHNGNTMLGGFHLDKQLIKRLNALELDIDFDLYAEGRFYK